MSGEQSLRCFGYAEMWMNVLLLLYSSSQVVLSETLTILPSLSAVVEQCHPLTLHCSYSGNQSVGFVIWRLDDVEVAAFLPGTNETCTLFLGTVDNNLYQYSCGTQSTMTIKNVTEERHAEKWNCMVNTGIQLFSSASTSVFVKVPVKHVKITQPSGQVVTVEENQVSSFTSATSVERPRSTIKWYIEDDKDHASLLPGGSVYPTNNDTLTSTLGTITYSFKRSQNGSKIYCTASNTNGEAVVSSDKILIHMLYNYGPSKVSLNISINTTVNEDDGIAINCIADCYPSCIYRWKRENTQLAKEILVLDPIRRNDAGLYTCLVTNSANSSWTASSTISINVRYKASVVEFVDILRPSENSTTLNEHERLSLVCTVDSYPGSSMSISRRKNVLEHGVDANKLLLTLENVRCEDTGVYVCSARNEYIDDSTESKQELQVFVRCPPRSVENSTTEVFAEVSQSVVLNVTVNAYPIPTSYSWYKEVHNEWLPISPFTKVSISIERLQSSLRIDKLTVNDFGLYGVSAYNGLVGNLLIKRFFVYMEGSPGMPFGFTCRLVSAISKSVQVRWTPGTDGGFEQTFHVQYKQDTKKEWTEVNVKEDQTTETGNRSVIIKNLSPGFSYQIRMFARNSKGRSPMTEKWTVSIPVEDKTLPTYTGAIVGGSIGGFVAGILVSILGLFLYWRFCERNGLKASTIQGGKGGDGKDIYYNVTTEAIKDIEGEDTRDQQQTQSACTSGQPPNVYEELQGNREEQPYEQMKQDITR